MFASDAFPTAFQGANNFLIFLAAAAFTFFWLGFVLLRQERAAGSQPEPEP